MFLEMRHSRPKEEEVDLWERILDPRRRVIGMDCEVERFKERLTGRGHSVRFKLEGNMFQLISTTFGLISIHGYLSEYISITLEEKSAGKQI